MRRINLENFWKNVLIPFDASEFDCWEWIGATDRDGYGQIAVGYRVMKAHRVAYSLLKGSFDKALFICHSCDCPSCVNPAHLFVGTAKDNVVDCMVKNRRRKIYTSILSLAVIKEIEELFLSGFTQKQIARKHKISQAFVSKIVNNKRPKCLGINHA